MAKLTQIQLGTSTYDLGAAWGNISGKPSTYPPDPHNHDFITYKDTRNLNESPDAVQAGLTVHLKSNTTDGLSDGATYHAVLNVKDWDDYSGGPYWQSAVTANNNMYFRRSTAGTTWGAWQKILSDNNYTNYTVSKTGGGASGTWGISITGSSASCTGNAASASSVAWGNVTGKPSTFAPSSHTHSYLPLSGGTITGIITRDYVGHSWIGVSHGQNCGIKLATAPSGGSASCLWSVKTNTGAWGCGGLTNTDNLYFVWGSDTNYNAGTNTANSSIYFNSSGYIYATRVYNAVWNDYAEFRQAETLEPGRVVIEDESGEMKLSTERLQPGGNIISDTYGHSMGETETAKTPLAVAGRVLAYTYEDRNSYPLGAAVCTGPNGTVSLMTREEIREYPERIIGTVSEIPKYETWGTKNIKVNGRIWIKVK